MSATSGPAAPRLGAAEWGLLLALSLLWGGSFFFGKVALAELPPLTLVLLRVGIGALALLALARATGQRVPLAASWRRYALLGLVNSLIPFSLIFWGQTALTAGTAAVLNATTPLFGAVLAHLFTADEKLTANRLAGVLVGMAGVAVMVGPAALSGLGGDLAHQLAVLGAAFSYGVGSLFGRRFRGDPPMVTAAGQVAATAVMLLPLALLADRPWELPAPSAATVWSVLGLALLSTALAYVIFFRILATAGAGNVLLVTLLIPVSAILLGALFLGEAVTGRQLAGMAGIALGLAAIDGRLLRRLRPRRPAP
ncbi:MAG TPA: DMT family transporter [Azospirillaceae bacterium]|nr:DMT family transporter [Azospirillaceae bacterium]